MRNGASLAPSQAEARGAETGKDLIHNLKVVLKELNECLTGLAVVREGELLSESKVAGTGEECVALGGISAAGIKAVKARCATGKQSSGSIRGEKISFWSGLIGD